MYNKILLRMRECVRQDKLKLTFHAIDEMIADDLMKEDLEHCILQGEILERQRDELFREYKYRIEGPALTGDYIEVVAKLNEDNTLIITAYML